MEKFIFLIFLFCINSIFSKETGTVEILPSDSKYLSSDYSSLFQIPITRIKNLFSNGGERSGYELSKAFDNSWTTHWRSEGQQGSSYTNKITGITYDSLINFIIITFDQEIYLDKIIYKTDNCVSCEGIGYPTVLKVYSKLSSDSEADPYSDSGFELEDEITSEASGDKVLFKFAQTIKCDQIKLEWSEMKTYPRFEKFTTAMDIQFFMPENEYINETILDLFSPDDYRFMTLSEKFNSLELIETLIQNSEQFFSFNTLLKEYLTRARLAASGALKFDSRREFTTNQSAKRNIIRQRGDILGYTRNTLKMSMAGTNRQSLGIFAFANEPMNVYVTGDKDDPLPRIRFTQYIGLYSNWLGNEISLVKGRQNLVCNNFNVESYSIKVMSGGPIYISNPYTSDQQSQNVKVYIEGGKIFPSFRLGEDDEDEYKHFLEEYVEMYQNNSESYYDINELFGFRSMMTVPATLSNNNYKNSYKGPIQNLNNWDDYIKQLFKYDGVQYEPSEPFYNIKSVHSNLHIRYAQPFGAAYASSEHIGIFSDGWLNAAIYGTVFGWGFAHEIGHTMDINERTVIENSNNMISKYDETFIRKEGSRGEFARSLKYLTPDDVDVLDRGCELTTNECKGYFTNLQMNYLVWWYIESLFPGYWGKLDNMYRYNYTISEGMTRTEREIFFTNIITGVDLGYYFNRWGFFLNNEGIFVPENASESYLNKMKEYVQSGKIKENIILKLWYLDYKEYMYNVNGGEGCYENKEKYQVEIEKVFYVNNNKTTILLPKINCEGHLGFEIYENNKLLGFTYDNIYVDTKQYEENYERTYKIIAYDRKLNPSKESQVKNIETNSNVCSYNSVIYNSIKEAIDSSTENEINIYLLKDTYEGAIQITKNVNIYISPDISNKNITIYKIDSNHLFNINENAVLKIEGKDNNNKIILDGMNIKTPGNLIYGYKGTFSGNFLILQNLNNSEDNGGAIYTLSCSLNLNNSLIYNNYASNGAGLNAQLTSGKSMISNLENVIFENNKAKIGGGIKNTGQVTLNKCEIKNCYASNNGGGLSNDGGGVTYLNDVKITGNIADNMGGGMYVDGFTQLNNVVISGNKANTGAGIAYCGGNDSRKLNVEKGNAIWNNIALTKAGGIYVKSGIANLNGGDIYENRINDDGKKAQSNSDLFYIENGKVNINSVKISGSIYKTDLGIIYLNSVLLKYNENSKIYIDFPIDGDNKTLILSSGYSITSEDLNLVSLKDPNSGILELSSENIIFSPKLINIIINTKNPVNIKSFLGETFLNEEKYYYGQSITLSQDLFKVEVNEYITKIYDKQGNNYKLGETIKLTKDTEFMYQISYKNNILFDFVDYQEEILIIPGDYAYLPSFRNDYSKEKEILYWKDFDSQETFRVSEKISGNKNRTFTALYSNDGDNFMVIISARGINLFSNFAKYKETIQIPEINLPKNNHLAGWMDLYSNIEYEINTKDVLVTKDFYLVAKIIGYVKYFISDELKNQKSYNINSTFKVLEQSNFPDDKILYWEDKSSGYKYEFKKEYILEGDLDLVAILDDNVNTGLIVAICFVCAFIILVVICLIHRYKKFKKWKEVDSKIYETNSKDKTEKN